MTPDLPKCERCGCPMFQMQVDEEGRRIAACGCTEIVGATDEDIPDYWKAPLEEYSEGVDQ